jgi:hypothetical protein
MMNMDKNKLSRKSCWNPSMSDVELKSSHREEDDISVIPVVQVGILPIPACFSYSAGMRRRLWKYAMDADA